MKIPKLNLKNLFLKGQKPNQEAFWNWIDSYWHKDEEIDQAAVKGLESTLANKLDKGVETTLLNAFNDAVSNVNSILKGEATPTSSPTAWTPGDPDLFEKWEATTVGTYTNFIGSNGLPIEVTLTDIDKKFVFLNMTNGVAKKTTVPIPGVNVSPVFDPLDSEKAQGGKQIADYINFSSKPFNYVLDFSKDNFGKYSELAGSTTFSEGAGSVFGKVAYVKLTGGAVIFPSNFVPQLGTSDYDPTKTNLIAFWKEYDKVRYFNETFTLEPLPVDGLISYYNFNGKTPNTLLSAIAPNYGPAFIGNTSGFRINTYGTQIQQIANASSPSSAIAIDVGNVTHYKATLYVSLAQELEINIGTTAYNVWSDYINIQFMSTSRIQHVKPSVPAGEIIYSSSTIEYPNTRFYLWEFIVNGNNVTVFYEGNELVTYAHSNTGSLFSIIFKNANDNFQSIKIEEL